MAIFLGVSAAPERILLSKISYAPVQHSPLHQKVLLCSKEFKRKTCGISSQSGPGSPFRDVEGVCYDPLAAAEGGGELVAGAGPHPGPLLRPADGVQGGGGRRHHRRVHRGVLPEY